MAKAMSIAGMIVAGLLALVFIADLAVGIPFSRVGAMTDVGFLVSCADPRLPELERLSRQQVAFAKRPGGGSIAAASRPAIARVARPLR